MGKQRRSRGQENEDVVSSKSPTLALHILVGLVCYVLGCWAPLRGSEALASSDTNFTKAETIELRAPGADPWAGTTHPTMATDGFNWTQLSMSRSSNFPVGHVKRFTMEDVREKGSMYVHHTVYARSIPAIVDGLAQPHADRISSWSLDDFRREWGSTSVVAAFSPDAR